MYKIGDKVKMFNNTIYKVVDIYQVSEEYMKEHNLIYKNRITLEKIKGEGSSKLDFALDVD